MKSGGVKLVLFTYICRFYSTVYWWRSW